MSVLMINDYLKAKALHDAELSKVLEEWGIPYNVDLLEDHTDKWYRTRRRNDLAVYIEFDDIGRLRIVQGPYHRLEVHAWVVGSGNDLYVVFVDAFKDRRGK